MHELKDKVAVITGGTSGIGLAVANLFAEKGAKIVITGRDSDRLNKAKNEMKNYPVLAIQGDVLCLPAIDTVYQKVEDNFGKIDILVANAGIGKSANIEAVDEKFFDSIVNINYKGVYFTVQRAIEYLNKNSSVILISSIQAHMGISGRTVYASTKAAITQLTKNLAAELIERKIRVNSISPGYIKTPMLDQVPDDSLERLKEMIPMKKLGTPKQIAQLALFLASDNSSYITGTDIVIDGGLSNLDYI
jgi:NAD(P)-dependent dehydrogenase (short-subunit alcohol dehydrogenase family)